MIARLDHPYIAAADPRWVAALTATLARHNHKIECDSPTMELVSSQVAKHCSSVEKEVVMSAALYDITSLQRRHLTTINVDGTLSPSAYLNLFGQPSLLLLENAPYEWPVYMRMLEHYKHDRLYGSIFAMVRNAAEGQPRTLRPLHAGGNAHFVSLTQFIEDSPEYAGLTKYKLYAVTDSDLTSPTGAYQPTPKAIYRYFTGISDKSAAINRPQHIDTPQQPLYHWHMWRKRAIENYFPPEAYEAVGMNATTYKAIRLPDRYYEKIDDKKTSPVQGYTKSSLAEVASTMGRETYERICDMIMVDGAPISEIRLFLLKIAKVI